MVSIVVMVAIVTMVAIVAMVGKAKAAIVDSG